MADLFHKQADKYAETRPSYPPELFRFIASKTPHHQLAWDVGTGSGQAAISLAGMYEIVVGTDTSEKQIAFAPKLPNIRYHFTPPTISLQDLEHLIGPASSVDLITVAQALHWFDLPAFYDRVRLLLRKPDGVLAVWCYTVPRINEEVDRVFDRLYAESRPFWEERRQWVDDEYRCIEFPFDPVEGAEVTGPFEFVSEREMDFGKFLTYIRSWSSYQTALEKGVDLLREGLVDEMRGAWGGDGRDVKVVRYPIHLRIGRVKGD